MNGASENQLSFVPMKKKSCVLASALVLQVTGSLQHSYVVGESLGMAYLEWRWMFSQLPRAGSKAPGEA